MGIFALNHSQGWRIMEKYSNPRGEEFVIVYRPLTDDFAWGSFYNEETGQWAWGHYNYSSLADARKVMLESYTNLKQKY